MNKNIIEKIKLNPSHINDYDLILTGDLGCTGATILKQYLSRFVLVILIH